MDIANEVNGQRLCNGKEAYLTIIFSMWRELHLISRLAALLISAFTACFTFFVYECQFYPNCPLYSKLVISKVQGNDLIYEIVDNGDAGKITEWGQVSVCRFVRYVLLINILAAIAGILMFCIRRSFSANSHTKLVPSTCIMQDIMQMTDDLGVTEAHEAFIETIVGSTKIKVRQLEEKLYRLKMTASKIEKQMKILRKKVEKESSVLNEEKKKTKRIEEEKRVLESVLEKIRRVVMMD